MSQKANLRDGKEYEFDDIKIDSDDLAEIVFQKVKEEGGDLWDAIVTANNKVEPEDADEVMDVIDELDDDQIREIKTVQDNLRNEIQSEIIAEEDLNTSRKTVTQVSYQKSNIFVVSSQNEEKHGCESFKLAGVFIFPTE